MYSDVVIAESCTAAENRVRIVVGRCTAGLEVNCSKGTYNPLTMQDYATACLPCPTNATTIGVGSTRRDDCVCNPGFYDANASSAIDAELLHVTTNRGQPVEMVAAVIDCRTCPVGTICARGSTIGALPTLRGFWRPSANSSDVRRCSDAAVGCAQAGTASCNVSLSGCFGGTDFDAQCVPRSGLSGPLCRLCTSADNASSSRLYYKAAMSSSRREATCADCVDDGVIVRFFSVYLTIVAVVLAATIAVAVGRRRMPERSQAELRQLWTTHLKRLWLACKPLNKGKVLIGE
jgi:hypothetical protein